MTRPTLDDIRRNADATTFPVRVLCGASSAACFFCAGYLGRLDAIHVCDAGIRDAFLCDLDQEKLAVMREIYPTTWRFERGDAYRLAERLVRKGEQFDVVIVDPWAGHAVRLLTKTFPMWYALARRHLLLTVPLPWFSDQGLTPTPEAAGAAIRKAHGLEVDVEEVRWRSEWKGGIYWVIVRKHDARDGTGVQWDHSDDDTLYWRVRRKLRSLTRKGRWQLTHLAKVPTKL